MIMVDVLVELQRQFAFAQQAKSSIRLSEPNLVELVRKLHELHIISFDLLHSVSGKEYITPTSQGWIYHVEKQAECAVADNPGLRLIQWEIISQHYWNYVAEEINERLQQCSQIALAKLATKLNVGLELLTSALEARLRTMANQFANSFRLCCNKETVV